MAALVALTQSDLAAPARRSVRVVAAARLDGVEAAFAELRANDAASFHDLRVALRRLRSVLRAFRPELSDTVRGRTRRRLRALAHATNPIREAEVVLEWLDGRGASSSRTEAARVHLVERIEREHALAAADARSVLERRLPKVIRKLSTALAGYSEEHSIDDTGESPTMAVVMNAALLKAVEHFSDAMDRAEASGEARDYHRVRIAVKRLRYLLELLPRDASTEPILDRLVGIQDALGGAHDRHDAAQRIVRELGELAAHDGRLAGLRAIEADGAADEPMRLPRLEPGLVLLAARAHRAERAAVEAFRAEWDASAIAALSASVLAVSASLLSA